jgi:hypothetical protein
MLVISATTADARLESSHSKTASLLLEKCAQVSLELTHGLLVVCPRAVRWAGWYKRYN